MTRIVVLGHPSTQGSKSVVQRGGKAWMIEGGNKAKRDALADWRHAVRAEAQRHVENNALDMFGGPVSLQLFFGLPRPASAPKRRRTWPIAARSGDADKLARAVLDALTGVLFADDSQVVGLTIVKDYAMRTGCVIEIYDSTFTWGQYCPPELGPLAEATA